MTSVQHNQELGSRLIVHAFVACLDNYGALVHDPETGETASIDASDADAIACELVRKGWRLNQILTTHFDWDHVQGNKALKTRFGATIIGPAKEAHKIPELDRGVGEGDVVQVGRYRLNVLATPGHTLGHVSYWSGGEGIVFVGDTLFAMGCGRVKEGTPEMMWASLQRLAALPPETQVFVGHDYAEANARFALTIEPENEALKQRAQKVRTCGAPNPTRLSDEMATNPFLRADRTEIRTALGMPDAPAWQVFAEIRARKNRF